MANTFDLIRTGAVAQRHTGIALSLLYLVLAAAAPGQVNKLSTPQGIKFGIFGEKPTAPAPTLFIFASTIDGALGDENFNRMGMILRRERGFLLVSMDLPCHGADRRNGEPEELAGWAFRLSHGENPINPFVTMVSSVLDYLIAEGYSDRDKIAASGTSRGGFAALHFTAAEPRVKWVVAFAPVTELTALREFAALQNHPGSRSLALARVADSLAGRSIWMCIGNDDQRVGTVHAITFFQRIVEAALARGIPPNATLRVDPVQGHTIARDSHENAAKWLLTSAGN